MGTVVQPHIGTRVLYALADDDVAIIRQRRRDNACRHGTPVYAGDQVTLFVTAHCVDGITVNGQAILDGDDSLWVCGATPGAGPGKWHR